MRLFRDFNEIKNKIKNPVATIGTFDGVHTGHQAIIDQLNKEAELIGGESLVITFYTHPRQVVFSNDNSLRLISSFKEKFILLQNYGVKNLLLLPFTREMAEMPAPDFVKNILVEKVGIKKMIVGYDHRFGKNREGNFALLKKLGPQYHFDTIEIPEKDINNVTISSTRIRQALQIGDVTKAIEYLGHDYFITGKIVKGNQVGNEIGFPTANVHFNESLKLLPADGVYAVLVDYKGKTHQGMLYIGRRPTLDLNNKTIEVNIFDFNETIYKEEICVRFKKWIRGEKKFKDLEELKQNLEVDRREAKKILNKYTD